MRRYLTCSAALLALSCGESSPRVDAPIAPIAPITAAPLATTSAPPRPPPKSEREAVPASKANSRDDVREEIRRREDAEIDLVARGYGERHPSRVVLRAELESLRASDKAWSPSGGAREARLALLGATAAGLLAAGRGENHPDMLAVRAKIRAAETSP